MTVETKILDMDATAIVEHYKDQKLSSEQVTKSYIKHIKKINPLINAMVHYRFEEALEEARVIDKQHMTPNKEQPLLGVPISIKESFHVRGLKTTGGLLHRQDIISKNNADVVQKMIDAGAIILGKTNTPTLCFCQETDNKLFGRTNNPWNLSRTAGGSSGGEGALLSAGGAALGIGSDIGGSIRFPSHFNGVVGFKPGSDQVSDAGHFPPTHPLQKRMLGIGPMGKSVRDVQLTYDIIAKKKSKEKAKGTYEIHFLADEQLPLSTKSKQIIGHIETYLKNNTTCTIKRSTPPYFNESAEIWQELMAVEGAKTIKDLGLNRDIPGILRTYIKEFINKGTDTHHYLSWALIGAQLFQPSLTRVKEIEQLLEAGDQSLSSLLEDRLYVFPTYHQGALQHGKLYKEIFSIRKTYLKYMPFIAYANVWGLPALTVPVGVDEENMPIGIQIMSKVGNEHAIFQVGKMIEKEFQGYKRAVNLLNVLS